MMLDDAQIEAQMQDVINATWPPAKREKAMRTGVMLAELNTFFADMSVLKAQKIAERDLYLQVIEYEAALTRYNAPLPEVPDDIDTAERVAAKAIIDCATQAVLDMFALRNPPIPEPLPEIIA